jgi:transposase InsO family protein
VEQAVKKKSTSDHSLPPYPNLVVGLEVLRPEQVWVSNLTNIRLCYGLVYLAVILDVFTRALRGWHLGRNLDPTLTLTALQRALTRYPAPEIHHSDQGIQYAATASTRVLEEAGVRISMVDVDEGWQNGYAERRIRTIKEEGVDLSEYLDDHDAYQQIERFLDDVYMHKRIHSSFGYLTPAQFEAQRRAEQGMALEFELPIA